MAKNMTATEAVMEMQRMEGEKRYLRMKQYLITVRDELDDIVKSLQMLEEERNRLFKEVKTDV